MAKKTAPVDHLKRPGRFAKILFVETAGIEPASGKVSDEASTYLVFRLNLVRGSTKNRTATNQPEKLNNQPPDKVGCALAKSALSDLYASLKISSGLP